MKVFVIVTSFNEPETIGKAVEQIIGPNRDLWPLIQLLVIAPDQSTLKVAEEVCQKYSFENFKLIKDPGQGKPAALNIAVGTITNSGASNQPDDLLILTDGDIYLEDDAIKKLLNQFADPHKEAVGGHPVSADSRTNMFGYFSHLFCSAAHLNRQKDPAIPMSGYLYAIRTSVLAKIFPLPEVVRAEDAYISQKLLFLGSKFTYASDAVVYVKFPKNFTDWFKQKTRSLGGNVQASMSARSILQDFRMMFFPLFFAKSLKELLWSLLLYPLRLLLWIRIYFNHFLKRYKSGAWERIESSK